MKSARLLPLLPSLLLCSLSEARVLVLTQAPESPASQESTDSPLVVAAPITSVALFKNGLAVVRRTASLPGGGRFEIEGIPEAVHGTFWLQSSQPLEVRASQRSLEIPGAGRWEHDPARELAGCNVRIRLRGEPATEIQGQVVALEESAEARDWNRAYEAQPRWNSRALNPLAADSGSGTTGPARFLAVDTSSGRTFIDLSMIAFINAANPPKTRRVTRPVLELSSPAGAPAESVTLNYLTKGLSFAPSYRLDIADPKRLTITQSAVLRNELADLVGVDVELISGFPSMEYSHVLWPLAPQTSWAEFFEQISRRLETSGAARLVLSQNATSNSLNPSAQSGAGDAPLASEGVDLHYHGIGRHDLRQGEALQVQVATASADYERFVEWRIADTRNEWGQPLRRQSWEPQGPAEDEGAWDALRFENPFDFPMTTAPATIFAGSRFQGQRTTGWVNPGEQTTVRITKALAVGTSAFEYEVDNGASRETVELGGRIFRRVGVKGELHLSNQRGEAVTMTIRREFSGDLTGSEGEPETKLLERGVYSVNQRQELVWTLNLAPGEKKLLHYTYDVLVGN